MRLALKLATGAGKTTVMAMIIAWQTVNAVRHPTSKQFTRGFLVCAPGLTIKDRLRVLQPNDPDSYYVSRELVPGDMFEDDHELPRFPTSRADRAIKRRPATASRAGRGGAGHPRNRRPDALARDASSYGHEEHPRHQ